MSIVFIRTMLLYFTVIIALRIMGKRQIGEMQPSELVIAILISEVATLPMQSNDIPLVYGVISIFTLTSLEIIISALSTKFPKFRLAVVGKPSILVRDGKVYQEELDRLRFSLDDLFEEFRLKDVDRVSDVSMAVLETNGQLSVMLNPEQKPPTMSDLGMKKAPPGLIKLAVKNGKLCSEQIASLGFTEQSVLKLLSENNLELKDIFYLRIDESCKVWDYELISGKL